MLKNQKAYVLPRLRRARGGGAGTSRCDRRGGGRGGGGISKYFQICTTQSTTRSQGVVGPKSSAGGAFCVSLDVCKTTRGAALGKARFPVMLVSYRPLASSWPGGNDPAPPRGCAIESALPIELVGEESLTWYCRKVISTGATCQVPPRDDKLIDTLRKAASRRED